MKASIAFLRAVAAAIVLLAAGFAYGDGMIIPVPPPPGRPIRERFEPLDIRAHRVSVEMDEGVTVTRVDQVFYNPNNFVLEGSYLFPVPENATINKFSMFIDGKETEAELLDSAQARQIYEDIVRRQRDPALLEYVNRRTFRARVYPIPAQGEKRIKLEYTEVLAPDNGVMTYRYPLNTEKFSGQPLKEVSVDVRIRSQVPLRSIVSPSHKVEVDKKNDHEARVGYEASNVRPDQDFVLYVTTSKSDFGLNLVTFRKAGQMGYFMAMISPGVEIEPDKVLPKDLILVFDTSGSMAEDNKMDQARRALEFCLRNLNSTDRFNIVDFSTNARTFRDGLVAADKDNVKAALDYVAALKPIGGTAIADALEAAARMAGTKGGRDVSSRASTQTSIVGGGAGPRASSQTSTVGGSPAVALAKAGGDRPCMIVFLTDGRPTIGTMDTQQILNTLKGAAGRVRLFVFGVGNDVNTELLDRLAEQYRGAREYVRPGEDIEIKVSSFYRKIASPVLADAKVEFQGLKTEDVYPRDLGDLFRGEQLTVVGRYDGSGDHAVVLRGTVNGVESSFTYEASIADTDTVGGLARRSFSEGGAEVGGTSRPASTGREFLPRYWATRKIGYLLDQIRLHGEDKELRDEVVRLSKEFGIVTPYTSFLVQEDEARRPQLVERDRIRVFSSTAPSVPPAGVVPSGGGGKGMAERARSQAGPPPAASPTGAVSGSAAVERSMATSAMKKESIYDADANLGGEARSLVKQVGDKTYYNQDGVWVVSTYLDIVGGGAGPRASTATKPPLIRVRYLSDDYFSLARRSPTLAAAFALGEKVIAEEDGKFYEVTGE